MKVIVRSNNPEDPTWIGTLTGRSEIHNIPLVIDENNKTFHVLGIIMPYEEELFNFLKTIPNSRQWEIFLNIKRFWDANKI